MDLAHLSLCFLLQGEACTLCPVLPAEQVKPETIIAIPGEKGEPGEPGTGIPGKNVSFMYKNAAKGLSTLQMKLST